MFANFTDSHLLTNFSDLHTRRCLSISGLKSRIWPQKWTASWIIKACRVISTRYFGWKPGCSLADDCPNWKMSDLIVLRMACWMGQNLKFEGVAEGLAFVAKIADLGSISYFEFNWSHFGEFLTNLSTIVNFVQWWITATIEATFVSVAILDLHQKFRAIADSISPTKTTNGFRLGERRRKGARVVRTIVMVVTISSAVTTSYWGCSQRGQLMIRAYCLEICL